MNRLYLFITILLFIGIIIYNTQTFKHIKEGIENYEELSPFLEKSFCKNFNSDSSNLQNACSRLTGENCKKSECCVWMNNKKCLAGNANGPTFSDNNLKNYYYMGKCYGSGCNN